MVPISLANTLLNIWTLSQLHGCGHVVILVCVLHFLCSFFYSELRITLLENHRSRFLLEEYLLYQVVIPKANAYLTKSYHHVHQRLKKWINEGLYIEILE